MVLIATHDLAVDAFADEVFHLHDGRIVDRQTGGRAATRP
jgi:ABC-type lipoprotein export system ATPase subunit